jgi:hypothetical protein
MESATKPANDQWIAPLGLAVCIITTIVFLIMNPQNDLAVPVGVIAGAAAPVTVIKPDAPKLWKAVGPFVELVSAMSLLVAALLLLDKGAQDVPILTVVVPCILAGRFGRAIYMNRQKSTG